jgi:hypothetical protein
MKPRLCIICFEHLDLVVHMHAQPISIVDNFPYHDAIITDFENKNQRNTNFGYLKNLKESMVFMKEIKVN